MAQATQRVLATSTDIQQLYLQMEQAVRQDSTPQQALTAILSKLVGLQAELEGSSSPVTPAMALPPQAAAVAAAANLAAQKRLPSHQATLVETSLNWTQNFDPYTQLAIQVALDAGQILERGSQGKLKIEDKAGAGNVVTDLDIKTEKRIIHSILSQFPDHGILAEETKSDGVPKNDYVWVIDPLDGSKNYSKGASIYSVSIALLHKNKPISAVIFVPRLNELFVANEQKAFLNGKPIKVTETDKLDKALLASGYPYAVRQNPLHCMEVENAMIQSGAQVDNFGTSVLHLAYVAAGKFDGKFHAGLRAWDVAAASLMIKHAGGMLTDWKGEPLNLLTLDIIDVLASNGPLHPHMLAIIKKSQENDSVGQ